jgi:hypothetical protein
MSRQCHAANHRMISWLFCNAAFAAPTPLGKLALTY